MAAVQTTAVVTSFLLRRGPGGPRILFLRRSARVGTYRGRWAGISGYLEGPDPLAQALREIEEETGLPPTALSLLRAGEPLVAADPRLGRLWLVHPFLFALAPGHEPRLDWEHTRARWARPEAVFLLPTVPRLPETLQRVYPLVPETVAAAAGQIAADRRRGARELARAALEALAAAATQAPESLRAAACYVARARPGIPAVALAVARAYARACSLPDPAASLREAMAGLEEAAGQAAVRAAAHLPAGVVVTYSRSSTVLATLLARRPQRVLLSEGRPGLEGVALARELAAAGIPVTLVTDAQLPGAVAEAQAVAVGADALLPDGSFLNKVGTLPLALAARRARVPFYVVAETWKTLPPGVVPPLEEGDPAEVAPSLEGVEARNRLFELTPARLVTAYLTEEGVLFPAAFRRHGAAASESWRALFGRKRADLA
jgi:translation initiation factor 2B subunit (eIF-2B alpha/beta/delta family)